MTSIFAAISVLMGALMLISKSRKRFPCFVGGWCAILAGGFMLGIPLLNSTPFLGWIWFCVWLAALPSLLGCVIALGVLACQAKTSAYCVCLGVVALLANIQPTLSFWAAAATGVVDANRQLEGKTDAVWLSWSSSAWSLIPFSGTRILSCLPESTFVEVVTP